MYDNASEVWSLFTQVFGARLTEEHRRYVNILMDPNTAKEDRQAVRSILESQFGIDPMYEIHWARSIAENPDLNQPDVRDSNRELLYDAWYNKALPTEDKNEARVEWEDTLGRDPFVDDGPMRDWES